MVSLKKVGQTDRERRFPFRIFPFTRFLYKIPLCITTSPPILYHAAIPQLLYISCKSSLVYSTGVSTRTT